MSGKFSRSKGRREEQQLVLYLTNRSYRAERILRQYQTAGQPDVRAEKDGKVYTFEMKSRREGFRAIYDLYYGERDTDGLLCFITKDGLAIAVSSDFEQLLIINRHFRRLSLFPPEPKQAKVYNRIAKLKEVKQAADFLVLRDNLKPRLFIRYWD